jgi:hypothetical protein
MNPQSSAAEQLMEHWKSQYGDVPPCAYQWYSKKLEKRLFRIHNLPGDRRSARCINEMNQILERQNSLLDTCLGFGQDYWLLLTEFLLSDREMKEGCEIIDDKSKPDVLIDRGSALLFEITPNDCKPKPFFSWRPESGIYRVYAQRHNWASGSIDDLLCSIARGEIWGVGFVSIINSIFIAPYEGGVDIVVKDETRLSRYKEIFKEWLPGASRIDNRILINSSVIEERAIICLIIEAGGDARLNESNRADHVWFDVTAATNDLLREIGKLHELTGLSFYPPCLDQDKNILITDEGLKHLYSLKKLNGLFLYKDQFPKITERGVQELRKALPDCEIDWP